MEYTTKKGKILEHLKKYGSLTSGEAIENYKSTRLSAVIYDLKAEGHNIVPERVSVTDDNGKEISFYVRYHYVAGN